jgi:hypothetical protein
MAVIIETIEFDNKIVKKFTTDIHRTSSKESVSTTWICPDGVESIRCLLVGGGGGASEESSGSNANGGGGAGGMIDIVVSVIPGVEYAIGVGLGGCGATYMSGDGYDGGNSYFNDLIAYGGGHGANVATGHRVGGSGGSGGGGSPVNGGAGGSGTIGQGNNGGPPKTTSPYAGGGGGGAGAAGVIKTGGNGLQSDITGELIYYAGGGGASDASSADMGVGGLGGGGSAKGPFKNIARGVSGTNGLGGGGGAAGYYVPGTYDYGGGGSGVVILQYHIPEILIMRY